MKFIIDAQLPRSLKQLFLARGYDCIHTFDLDQGNKTPDRLINQISIQEKRIVITKDSDFFYSHMITKEPYKLILVKLGNISKKDLLQFFSNHFEEIILKIQKEDLVLIK